MTTLSLEVNIPDEEAKELEQLSALTGEDKNQLAQLALVRLLRMIRTSFKTPMSAEEFREIQAELSPYAKGSGYESEEDFLNRSA